MSPPYEYVAYIDESGDPGLARVKGVDENGASEWLILGAIVVRRLNEEETYNWVNHITEGFRGHQRFGIHFTNLNPAKKLLACQRMVQLPLRCFVIASNKKNMKGYNNPFAALIPSKNWFYCWLTRLLRGSRISSRRIACNVLRHLNFSRLSIANVAAFRILK
jgi:hypothetical protein